MVELISFGNCTGATMLFSMVSRKLWPSQRWHLIYQAPVQTQKPKVYSLCFVSEINTHHPFEIKLRLNPKRSADSHVWEVSFRTSPSQKGTRVVHYVYLFYNKKAAMSWLIPVFYYTILGVSIQNETILTSKDNVLAFRIEAESMTRH